MSEAKAPKKFRIDKTFIIKLIIYVLGIVLVGLGVQIIIYTNVGTAPIDAMNYYLARIYLQLFNNNDFSTLKTTIGVASLAFGTLTVVVLFLITKNKALIFTWFNIFIVSLVISLWGLLFDTFAPLATSFFITALIALLGIIIVAFGVFLVLVTEFPAGPPEEIMRLINKKANNLLVAKLLTETFYLVLAFIAMIISITIIDGNGLEFTQVGVFTLITLVLTSLFVSLFDFLYRKITTKKVVSA
ncbi:MAG: hypothetical protein BWX74_00423 [Tenericutes bacterium ADurb.Bin087]|nr:MAG: hypothetical protein BWX74_00423 [Tenericutes bacterium ADurb.Bin087]